MRVCAAEGVADFASAGPARRASETDTAIAIARMSETPQSFVMAGRGWPRLRAFTIQRIDHNRLMKLALSPAKAPAPEMMFTGLATGYHPFWASLSPPQPSEFGP